MRYTVGAMGAPWALVIPLIAGALAAGAGLSGCATPGGGPGSDAAQGEDPVSDDASIGLARGETLPSFAPEETAERNWAQAERAFEKEDYLLAQRYYVYIRRKFPYSKFAVLSDLRVADCQFARKRHLEAIDSYQNFARLHPTHPQAPYALFRVGKAQHALIPSDWFFLPGNHEKDQTPIRDAASALSTYLRRFPDDANAKEARELLREVRKQLLAHERSVADFYEREGKLRGYVGRLERIRSELADVGVDPALLLEIVRAYVRLDDRERAQRTLAALEGEFPTADEARRARQIVGEMRAASAPSP